MTQDQPPSPDLPDQAPEGVSEPPSEISEPLPEPTEPLLELSGPFSEPVEDPSEPFETPLEPSETLSEISEPFSDVVEDHSASSETLLETSEALPQTIEASSDLAETLSEPLLLEPLLSEVTPSESALSEEILSEAVLAEETLAEPLDDFTPSETAQTAEVSPPSSEVPQVVEQPISQTLQAYWERARPVIKTQTIRVLQVTIQGLESAVSRLEAEPRQELPSPSDPLAAPGLAASESKTSGSVASDGSVASESMASDKSGSSFSVDKWWQKVRPAWEQFQVWWAKLLTWVRSRLPADWSENLSDRALSGAIAGLLVVLLWITSGVFSTKPKPTPVAIAPSPKVTAPAPKPPTSPQVKGREPAKPTLSKPAEEKPVAQKPAVRVSPSLIPKPSPPPPPLKLTPEQTLIARIQDQVAEISNQYLNGLIQSVQANFRSSQLTVKVGTGWYGLSQLQQNKLANEMLGRAKELDFSKLEITDPEGALLARSPVVGPEMIILKRQTESQEAAYSSS